MTLNGVQWTCAVLGALMVGLSKTAISGLSVFNVALLSNVLPSSKQATGFILPMLIFGDCIAVVAYRRHAQWRYVWKLFPWTAVGIVLGYLALGRISDRTTRSLIGCIILGIAALQYWRIRRPAVAIDRASVHPGIAIVFGMVAGFVTLIANAAGPLMAVYLIGMRLPKMHYVGTSAVFFLLLNLFKVPFMAQLGLVTWASLKFNLMLAPAVLIGAAVGRWLLSRVDQKWFEKLILGLSAVGGIVLLI